ncbi:MAG TPA: YihY/virulence factor BrkB family protein [Solirubrobacteraceae bacterium]|nr:YihY/virulence factor BrkB family protein [Solirubrobacteraceae bacterium]
MRRYAQRVFDFYWGLGIADDVPALTYYLLLSLAPFALGLAAMQALLLDNVLSAIEVADQLNRFLPNAVHEDITRLVLGTRDNSPLLLALAVVTMLWTTSGAIGVVERCESRILNAPRHGIVTGRLRNMLLGAGVALMVAAASAGAPVIGDAADTLDLRGALPGGLLLAVNTVGSIVVFAGIYRWAPRAHLRWRSAAVGAIPAGIAIQAVPALVGLYVGQFVGFAAVRLFLILAVVLIGLYVMAMVILVGSGLAVKRERRHLRRVLAGGRAVPDRFGPAYAGDPQAEAERPPAPTGA